MYFNEIDFPNQIIDAIRDGTLVVFAGAGASMGKPTSLPDYKNLTQEIAEGTGKELLDDNCEAFLGSLKAEGIDVNQQAADILTRECKMHNPLHEAIVDLFESDDKIKIVTTNYDQMFEQVIESRNGKPIIYNAPALPLGNDVEGIVHIHGNVDNPKYMVVTDEDFGRAYLTDGYASKFLVQLFESYTVLFVGYSYNDTITNYLTRAMSRSTVNKRYILTDDRKNWSILGIEPVYYKQKCFAVMREGLVRLGKAAKKGLLEWKAQLIDIKDMPPKDLTGDTEIDYCLENDDKSLILASIISGKEWLEYLDRKNVFEKCFTIDEEQTTRSELWADWLCNNCVGKDDESLLLLILKHNNIISKYFANRIIQKLLFDTNVDINFFTRYILILDSYLTDCWVISDLIQTLVSNEKYHLAFLLYKKLYECKTILEKKSWIQSDNVECKHLFSGEYYQIQQAWEKMKKGMLEVFPYELIIFVIEKVTELHCRYEMAGQASKDNEPLDLTMLEIEKREESYRESPLQIMSEMLLEASCSLQNKNKDLLRTTLLQGINSESTLLKKITLKAIREVDAYSPDEKLDIILDKTTMQSSIYHEQVFLLVAKIFADLDNKSQEKLINAIESLKKETPSRSNAYEIYNWYVWLHSIQPNNKQINERIKNILSVHNFAPREHPELIMWSSPARWIEDQSPLSEEEMINAPVPKVIDKLENYYEDPFEGPSRRGLLETFSSAVSKNVHFAKNIINSLLEKRINADDIWQSVFYGLQKASGELKEVWQVFISIIHNIESVGYIYGAAEFLWNILKREDIRQFFIDNEEEFYDVSVVIWNHKKQEEEKFQRTIDAVPNTTEGCILLSWVYMISLGEERVLPEKYKNLFDEAIQLESWERKIAICILVGYFNFFCYRDIEWSKKTLLPFLTCDNQVLFSSAWEGMVFFSGRIIEDTVDIIKPIYYSAIKNINWLEDETKTRFIDMLLALMIYYIDKPTLKFIPEFYRENTEKEWEQLIQSIKHRLKNMDAEFKLKWWNTWLKHFLENRKSNKPCILGENENEAITELLTVLPEMFDEAVDVICKGRMPTRMDSTFWLMLRDMHIDEKYTNSMAKFMTRLLKNIASISWERTYIQDIVRKMTKLNTKERKALQEVLLKWNIDAELT